MATGTSGNGHSQLRTLFVIIATSTITVLFTFLGLSATNVNIAHNVPQIRPHEVVSLYDDVRDSDMTYEGDHFRSEGDFLRRKAGEIGGESEGNRKSKNKDGKLGNSEEKLGKTGDKGVASYSSDECKKRLPKAIIAGIQKCGTTALLKFLDAHPQIKACTQPAEPQYFTTYYSKDISWYRNLMPCTYPNEIAMEKSPPYFYRGYCAGRIYKMDPEIKLIFIVKDPVTRTESMWSMLNSYHGGKPFEDSVTTNNKTKINTNTLLTKFSNYQNYVGAWLKVFERRQILFIDGHSFEEDPAVELNVIEKFLNIDTYFTPDRFVFNETKGKFCVLTDTNQEQCLSAKKGRQHPNYSPKVRKCWKIITAL